jgi:hypothetical protein
VLIALGCGDSPTKPQGPIAGLAYMPRDAGLVLVAPTDLDSGSLKRLDKLGSRFPGWGRLKQDLETQVAVGANFERDIRPQLGKPLVFALGRNGTDQYAALQVKDAVAMRRLLELAVATGKRQRLDDYKGALITKENRSGKKGGTVKLSVIALDGDVLVAAGSEQKVKDAIARSGGSDNLASNAAITSALAKLGDEALFRVAGDAQLLLDSAPTSDVGVARRVPWIKALGAFTARGVVDDDGVNVEVRLRTDRVGLRETDLPLAVGAAPPLVHAPGAPAIVALREPDRLVRFIEAVSKATDPNGYARYRIGVDQLSALGVDLHRDLLGRISNFSLALPSNLAATFQADLKKGTAPAFAIALDRAEPFLEDTINQLVGRGTKIVARGSGQNRTYVVMRGGLAVASFGVRGDALVGIVGLGELPKPVAGRALADTEGALVLKADLGHLVRVPLVQNAIPEPIRAILGRLGELKLSVRAETAETTARGHLRVGR